VLTDGFHDQTGVFGEPGGFVVAGQIDRDGLVACPCSRGTTWLQYQAAPPAPGIRTNELTAAPA
jgi:hypothetical protein